ncbi:hypothetical protein ABGB09_13665 [Streptomyces sp. B8F3]|uniref:hypothetical protein n=1 Tax=Streptomyces sp. B8F3 TaxID=3153573 RepID=UPI00325F3890
MPLHHVRRKAVPLAAAVAMLSVLAACGDSDDDGGDDGKNSASPAAEAGGATDLSKECPETIVVQTAWWPDITSAGAMYQLLGDDMDVDANAKKVTAPLVASGGKDTGVKLELRSGGPAIGFNPTSSQMYTDDSIHLGIPQGFDEAIQNSDKQPTLAVMSLLAKNPQVIMWDPEKHPDVKSIEDIGKTDTTVVYVPTPYMDYLTSKGILKKDQVDSSGDGSPARFVAAGGDIATSGYATEDPYIYEEELPDWGKPVASQLAYEYYPNPGPSPVIRPADKAELAPCLEKLVPVIQQGAVDLMENPDPVIDKVIELRDTFKADQPFSKGVGTYSVEQMQALDLVAEPGKPVGEFDTGRVQELIDVAGPVFESQKKPIKDGLTPEDLVTNEFIDTSITLGGE